MKAICGVKYISGLSFAANDDDDANATRLLRKDLNTAFPEQRIAGPRPANPERRNPGLRPALLEQRRRPSAA